MVSPTFESLAPQAQSVTAPVENLDAVCGSVGENEQVSRERVGVEFGADQVGESVETEPQIDGGSEPEFGGGRDGQHDCCSNPRRTATRNSGRVSAGNRRTIPEGMASSMGAVGDGVTRMGTMRGRALMGVVWWGESLCFQR